MKTVIIIVAAVILFAVANEILTMMGIAAGLIGFLGMIAKEAIEK